jgi:hypothetical protein
MPLKKAYGKAGIKANFHELKKAHPNMPAKQLQAIVLSTADKAAKKAGKPGRAPKGKKKSK